MMKMKKKTKRIWNWTDPQLSDKQITTRYTLQHEIQTDRPKTGAQIFESATPTWIT